MKLLLCSSLLLLACTSVSAQPASSESAKAFTQRLYRLARLHPTIGALDGNDLKLFAPFLSKALISRMSDASACEQDWGLHHHEDPGFPIKGPFTEAETFTGSVEGAPQLFRVGSVIPQKNGSVRVNVKLTFWDESAPEKPWFSQAVLLLVQENGHLAVDNVSYLGENSEERLSKILASDCNGRHFAWTKDNPPDPLK